VRGLKREAMTESWEEVGPTEGGASESKSMRFGYISPRLWDKEFQSVKVR